MATAARQPAEQPSSGFQITEAGQTALRYAFLAEHVRDVTRHQDGSFTIRYFRGSVVGTGFGANLDEAADDARRWFDYRVEVPR